MQFELAMSLVCLFFLISIKKTQAYRPSEMVNITVYYETLCPSSRSTFYKQYFQTNLFSNFGLLRFYYRTNMESVSTSWSYNGY